jgi:GNAT superfamily N-acetyltransferase
MATVGMHRHLDRPAIRPAQAEHAGLLSALAMRSKALWGYPAAFMDAIREELHWSADDIALARYSFFVCEVGGRIVGFHALDFADPECAELEALFVEPDCVRCGYGRQLLAHAVEQAGKRGAAALVIQGDPHAETFYLAAGAIRQGARESHSIPGRQLPLFRIEIRPAAQAKRSNDGGD